METPYTLAECGHEPGPDVDSGIAELAHEPEQLAQRQRPLRKLSEWERQTQARYLADCAMSEQAFSRCYF